MNYIVSATLSESQELSPMQCPMCEAWIDKRDTKEFYKHMHGINQLIRPILRNTSFDGVNKSYAEVEREELILA